MHLAQINKLKCHHHIDLSESNLQLLYFHELIDFVFCFEMIHNVKITWISL